MTDLTGAAWRKSTRSGDNGGNTHTGVTATEIKIAIEQIFSGVKVASVNTINRKGKSKRFRFTVGKRPDTKRAIVKLAEGDSIEIFEQQT